MPDLFTPYTLKGVTLRNRIVMSPMTMYNSVDGKTRRLPRQLPGRAGGRRLRAGVRRADGDHARWQDDHLLRRASGATTRSKDTRASLPIIKRMGAVARDPARPYRAQGQRAASRTRV
jgi:hypothetical protein